MMRARKPVYVDGVRFEDAQAAAIRLGVTRPAVQYALHGPKTCKGHAVSYNPPRKKALNPVVLLERRRGLPLLARHPAPHRLGVYREQRV